MKFLRANTVMMGILCLFLANITHAYWTRVSWIPDGGGTHSVGPVPEEPPQAYGGIQWESSSTGGGILGYAWGMVDTRAYADGRYAVLVPPDGIVIWDAQLETSGIADANGTSTKEYHWVGSSPPGMCDAFKVARRIFIDSNVEGDADNGSLTAGHVVVSADGSGHVNIIVNGGISEGLDVNYDVDADCTEGGSWEPSLTISFGENPISLTWDDPITGWLDNSFADHEQTPYDFEREVTLTNFGVSASAYVHLTEIKSSNNATKAMEDMIASSGYLSTDTDYYGLPSE